MCGKTTQKDLEDEQGDNHEQVFAERALRRRKLSLGNWIADRGPYRLIMLAQESPAPYQRTDPREQNNHAGQGPQHILCCWQVTYQRLGWPVIGVGGNGIRPLSGGGPGGPEKE